MWAIIAKLRINAASLGRDLRSLSNGRLRGVTLVIMLDGGWNSRLLEAGNPLPNLGKDRKFPNPKNPASQQINPRAQSRHKPRQQDQVLGVAGVQHENGPLLRQGEPPEEGELLIPSRTVKNL